MAGTLLETYNRLAQALVVALRRLGLPVEVQEHSAAPNGQNTNPVCFEVPSTYEITVGGKKLVGSAQARRKEGVLQHGTLPLTGNLARIVQVLVFPDEDTRQAAAERLLRRAVTVESALGHLVTWDQAAELYMAAFQETLQLDLRAGEVTSIEREHARELEETKYAHPEMGR